MEAVGLILLALVGIALVIVATIGPPRTKPVHSPKKKEPFVYSPTNFLIYNYFPKHAIRVDVITGTKPTDSIGGHTASEVNVGGSAPKTIIEHIAPMKSKGLTRAEVLKYMKGGNILRFYVLKDGTAHHFSDYLIDTGAMERIKALHVGMITSRFILTSTDSLRMSTTAGNAVGGNAWLKIHNLTEIPLQLNDDVLVPPHSVERFLGYLNQGVTLGYIFKDPSGLYPDYQYLEPFSDVYYGVVSDIRQPISGCAQLEYTDDCEYGQTLWPFETGVM